MTHATVPCKHCGVPTRMLGTRQCDNCHEVEMRAPHMPVRVLASCIGLRPEVLAFARKMEMRLQAKDAEMGGNSWKQSTARNLRHYPCIYSNVLRDLIEQENLDAGSEARIVLKAADVANFAMMIADVCGGLK